MKNGKKWAIRASLVLVFIVLVHLGILRAEEKRAINAASITLQEKPSNSQEYAIRQIVRAFRLYGDGDKRKLAYILATARHESRFTPIKEYRGKVGTAHRATQDKYWYTGFYGRGFVQLTHESNYREMGDFLGIDLVNKPDLALDPIYAAKIIVYGMMNGSFGKKLGDYINDNGTDYWNARRSVNGTDKATLIASYAQQIYPNL